LPIPLVPSSKTELSDYLAADVPSHYGSASPHDQHRKFLFDW